jgi:RND superfamily putative drug exporter
VSRFVVRYRWWVLAGWLVLAVAGGVAAPKATAALSYDFGLPGRPGYETNRVIAERYGSGGDFAPILLVVTDPTPVKAATITTAVSRSVLPGSRCSSPVSPWRSAWPR